MLILFHIKKIKVNIHVCVHVSVSRSHGTITEIWEQLFHSKWTTTENEIQLQPVYQVQVATVAELDLHSN